MSKATAIILISGAGTTMENLILRGQDGRCQVEVKGVIASKRGIRGIDRARGLGVPVQIVARDDYMDATAYSRAVMKMVNVLKPDLLLMAGFLSYLHLPKRYFGRTMNIHPSLLPKFGGRKMYGGRVHEAVLKAGESESGCTVHFVDDQYDHGPIILQKTVPVLDTDTPDTLAERVMEAEREAYPEAINLWVEKRLLLQGNKVKVLPARAQSAP